MSLAPLLGLLLALAFPAAQSDLEAGRELLRHGLLGAAEERLHAARGAVTGAELGRVWLLLGNVSWERGRHREAHERWQLAAAACGDAQVDAPLAAAVAENLALAAARLRRDAELERAARRIRWGVLATALAGAAAFALASRRAGGQSRAISSSTLTRAM